jgi:acetate kinase
MKILVFNCGSSSLKYKVLSLPDGREWAGGEAQRVGPPTARPSVLYHHADGKKVAMEVPMRNHAQAFDEVMKVLMNDPKLRPDAVGHRLVHGGSLFVQPTLMDDKAIVRLNEVRDLAPIHNPPAMELLAACGKRYPDLPQVAVFDTAFHATIPDYVREYALPKKLSEELGLYKYGFHGTSHQYVMEETAALMKIPVSEFNAVSCHLGSGGASLCAIVKGRSVDNTMGFSPLQGLVMSTRSGDLDPAVTLKLLALCQGDGELVSSTLNNKSGILGMSRTTSDIRDIIGRKESSTDDPNAVLAEQVYLWRLRKYLGAYLAVVGNPRAIIFTDTIGETIPEVRWAICSDMEYFGLKIDAAKNSSVKSYPCDVAAPDSRVRIFVVQTNEELAIARRTFETVKKPQKNQGRKLAMATQGLSL